MLLKAHMEAKEEELLAISKIPANSGHPLHKGTPREAFIKKFLEDHISQTVSIGTGEIIDSNSKPKEDRNQFDIVIYRKNFPKIHYGGGIDAFLVESVISTIEVKSTLTKAHLEQAIKAAVKCKNLESNIQRTFHVGYIPPSIFNFIVAYNCPVTLEKVYHWIKEIHQSLNISEPILPVAHEERIKVPSPSIDSIFILGKGFIQFDNSFLSFINDSDRKRTPLHKWISVETNHGSMLMLFTSLLSLFTNFDGALFEPSSYLKSVNVTLQFKI